MRTDPAVTDWLAQFAEVSENRETLDRLVTVVDDEITAALPMFTDPTLRRDLDASTRSNWKGFLAVVTRDIVDVRPAPEIYDLARTLARRGYELPVLLAVYRIGQRSAWQFITETRVAAIGDPELRAAVLMQLWPRLASWLDTMVEALIVTFAEERDQWQRGARARRAETVRTILAGQAVDVDDATTALSYPLRQRHTAFAVWVDEHVADADVQRLLDATPVAVSAALGADRPLTITSGARTVWCWSATTGPSKPLSGNDIAALPEFVHVAVGTCHPGVDGFRRSHAEALAAQAVAHRRGASVVRYDDVELACLAAGIAGEDGMTTLVRRELGALAAADDGAARLRDTLRLYLEHAGDARAVGEILNLHPNTVRYRIRQAEGLLGHSVDHRRVYLELALHIVSAFGST
ncbi:MULTISPECIES: helix-turn-helix domain-containing protein [unclassified Mycobacterium]|uniref:PucR family transcriptional regulator n=1 Tax=unclassified Mycobacterium TaxID=2642494 RepID=UPI0005652FB7|nr:MULTISPECIES: helix-turn-helix domain-containing protein [unclassified Mycobacterium]SEB22948.1 PucR C-terminal helix-turn-helix domain-containing protein [Mycobacterium sp. 283mftsu]